MMNSFKKFFCSKKERNTFQELCLQYYKIENEKTRNIKQTIFLDYIEKYSSKPEV